MSSEDVCARFNAAPYYRLLGLEAESARPGTSRVTLRYKSELTQIYGGIHGGALLSLADSAVNVALATTFSGEETTATVELTMHFLAPAEKGEVIAESRILKRGLKIAFADCVITSGGAEIARAQAVCYIGGERAR